MDLLDFANKYAGDKIGIDPIDAGPAARRLFDRIKNEGLTRSLLATTFWRAWLASDAGPAVMSSLGASRGVFERSRTIIVERKEIRRVDMIVLDPSLPRFFSPTSHTVAPPNGFTDYLMLGAVYAFGDGSAPLLGTEAPQIAAELSSQKNTVFSVVLAREPEYDRVSVPASPLTVDTGITQSTAGVLVEDTTQPGRYGVTAALHGVDGASSVTVDAYPGTIVRTDSVTDSAFIEVNLPSVLTKTVNGVMAGMTPRGKQAAEFVGITSSTTSTVITGWDAQIPQPSARRQACVYTRRDAQAGDSGAALVTDDNWIVGFAFERTKPGDDPEMCSWIWADSVLTRLKVKLS